MRRMTVARLAVAEARGEAFDGPWKLIVRRRRDIEAASGLAGIEASGSDHARIWTANWVPRFDPPSGSQSRDLSESATPICKSLPPVVCIEAASGWVPKYSGVGLGSRTSLHIERCGKARASVRVKGTGSVIRGSAAYREWGHKGWLAETPSCNLSPRESDVRPGGRDGMRDTRFGPRIECGATKAGSLKFQVAIFRPENLKVARFYDGGGGRARAQFVGWPCPTVERQTMGMAA
jgi:hypothetical protein